MGDLIPLDELMRARVVEQYWQPLKTIDEAIAAVGWELVDKPECCGQRVEIKEFLGGTYGATCNTCNRTIFDITGPEFGNSWVTFPKNDYDLENPKRWIAIAPDPADTREGE